MPAFARVGCSFRGCPTFNQSKEDLMPVMDIFPSEVRKTVPPLHSQEGIDDPIVHLKFFMYSGWTWYVTEGSPEDNDFIFSDSSLDWKRSGETSHSLN